MTNSKSTSTAKPNPLIKDRLTFDDLIEVYGLKVFNATSEQLKRVSPNGLKELFSAMRRYSERKEKSTS